MNYLTLLVLAYLAALLWFGIRGGTRERELNAFLTAGGSAGALLCAFSLVSTIIGGSATLGMGALAQKVGPAAFWWLGEEVRAILRTEKNRRERQKSPENRNCSGHRGEN